MPREPIITAKGRKQGVVAELPGDGQENKFDSPVFPAKVAASFPFWALVA